MKIKLSADYDNSEALSVRLIKQFKTPQIDLSNIEFVTDESYDKIIFFNYINCKIKENTKSFIFPHEPTWSGSHQKHIDDNTTIFGFDSNLYNKNCIESIAYTFYGGRGPWVDSLDFWSYDSLINKTFFKTKNISSSVTKLKDNLGQTCLYPIRYIIYELINNLPFIDRYDGSSSPKKNDALINYRFNLAIENEYHNNWISEKFYDSILTNTIPIYYGCKNIKDIYPEDGYILINDINNIENILKEINENAIEIYNQKLPNLLLIKERYFKEFNLLQKIIDL